MSASDKTWKIEAPDKASVDDLRYVIGQLSDFNDAHSPTPYQRRDIRLFVRDSEGTIQAGLIAGVSMHSLLLQILWVHEDLRHSGVGRDMVTMAEGMAREVGATSAIVETTDFQAPGFYRKLGYQVICEITDSPIGATTYLMRKRIA